MHDLNNFMRDRDVREAELSIEYLNNEVSGTKSEALKDVFYNLIKTNTEKKMLAFSREDYLFRIIDPPIAPEEKSSPNRPLICILGFLLGLMFSFIYVLFMNYIFRNSEK
jgi:LPS O-antigen subunit length determinant protein (WzzB/FepE family)